MKVRIHYPSTSYDSYRASRTLALFNVAYDGTGFDLDADIPTEDDTWAIGVVVGPSGSGKTSIGRVLDRVGWPMWAHSQWPLDRPIVDAIAPDGDYAEVTGALASVGLGTVPAWLRPYHVLSNGEQFRAEMAKIVITRPPRVILDEFTSVLDRQVAKLGAHAFGRAWRRTGGRAILLTPHHDIIEWVNPDWILDTGSGKMTWPRGSLQRPPIELDIRQVGWKYWPVFAPHHYLQGSGPMAFGTAFVAFVDDQPVAHLGLSGIHIGRGIREARLCRMVVMPEWQGAGISMKFLNAVAERELQGAGFIGHRTTSLMHTAHPGFIKALLRDPHWRCLTTTLVGSGTTSAKKGNGMYGMHFRSVASFRYYGQAAVEARKREGGEYGRQPRTQVPHHGQGVPGQGIGLTG